MVVLSLVDIADDVVLLPLGTSSDELVFMSRKSSGLIFLASAMSVLNVDLGFLGAVVVVVVGCFAIDFCFNFVIKSSISHHNPLPKSVQEEKNKK